MRAPLKPFLHVLPKKPGRFDQQDENQDAEHDSIRNLRTACRNRQALRNTEDIAAQHRTGDIADAAKDGRDKSFQAEHAAHIGGNLMEGIAV